MKTPIDATGPDDSVLIHKSSLTICGQISQRGALKEIAKLKAIKPPHGYRILHQAARANVCTYIKVTHIFVKCADKVHHKGRKASR